MRFGRKNVQAVLFRSFFSALRIYAAYISQGKLEEARVVTHLERSFHNYLTLNSQ